MNWNYEYENGIMIGFKIGFECKYEFGIMNYELELEYENGIWNCEL